MTAQLVLWSHALAALLFAVAALAAGRSWRTGGLGRAHAAALGASALWALAVAGIGAGDLAAQLAGALRDLAWLGFAWGLIRRDRAEGRALAAVCLSVGFVVVAGAGLAVAAAATGVEPLATARTAFGMMAAAGALVLARHLHSAGRGGMRAVAAALALLWGADLLLLAADYAGLFAGEAPIAARGGAAAAAALLLMLAPHGQAARLGLSRPAATGALAAVALAAYVAVAAALAGAAAMLGGVHGRALQAGVVVGATTALLTLTSGSWLSAWAKVKLAKHLFRHRYDYRVEWQRFTEKLGAAGEPLEQRAVAAIAALLDAPAGLLLGGDALTPAGAWRWDEGADGGQPLAAHLLTTRRIVELDAVRAGRVPEDGAVLPAWMTARADAWTLVPLFHGEALAGAVLLARPPVARALDWEDFDLLRVAGRQAASYLAEDRAGRALAEAARFDEFNRRFAFILHDIKNLVSQQLLVARNAERHAANPHFRADMVATLKDSADRMTALLARLSHQDRAPAESLAAVDLAALVERVARSRRAQHPVTCTAAPLWATAHAQRLEQVLGHLVQNAVEASPAGAPVALRVLTIGDRVAIEVADRGTGMSAAFVRERLFRPFASTKTGGFGIGAFEARQLVEAMGGTLAVDSREGEGSCLRVLLPAAAALEQAA